MRITMWMATILCLFFLAVAPEPTQAVNTDQFQPLRKFSQILDLVESYYVKGISRDELINDAMKGMLEQLDPHSAYLDKKDFKEMQEITTGEFSGIGIEISMEHGKLIVVSPIEDTPAYKAGLQAGDIIIEIDGTTTQNISLQEAVGKIRGKRGTKVTLTILHKKSRKPEKVEIVRDSIPLMSVKSEMLDDGVVLLRITRFNDKTTKELHDAIKKARSNGKIKGVVLDLRNNPGGLLTQAVSVADTFLSDGLIVYIQGREESSRKDFNAAHQSSDIAAPMVTIINAGSASASEIVAGALKDHNRTLIIGERSFGKGSVQTIFPMPDGAGIKLTTARYYTPSGRSIQAQGIDPDIVYPFVPVNGDEDDSPQFTIREQDLSRHLINGNGTAAKGKFTLSDKAKTMLTKDNQLRLALQLVKQLPRIKKID